MQRTKPFAITQAAQRFKHSLLGNVVCLIFCSSSFAAPVFYSDDRLFEAAFFNTPGFTNFNSLSITDFENVSQGRQIRENTPFNRISYSTNLGGLGLFINGFAPTTSGGNSLGVDDRADHEFFSGDEIRFDFDGLLQGFGLYIISIGGIFDNDFQFIAANEGLFNRGAPINLLPGESELDERAVYFFGVIDPNGISSARLNSFGDQDEPIFGFRLDDLITFPVTGDIAAVPEPTSLALLSLGLLAFKRPRKLKGAENSDR